jgi:hypothetical protein
MIGIEAQDGMIKRLDYEVVNLSAASKDWSQQRWKLA